MKVLVFTPSDGSIWHIPADVIAKHRANYYSKGDPEVYIREFESGLSANYALIDWAQNNMDWSDVQPFAKQINPPSPDYQDDWVNGDVGAKEVPHVTG